VGILLFLSRLPWHVTLALIMIFSSMMQFSPKNDLPRKKKNFVKLRLNLEEYVPFVKMKMSQLIKNLMNICLEAHKVLCTRKSALGVMQYNGKRERCMAMFLLALPW
jgi:hypothetical protein